MNPTNTLPASERAQIFPKMIGVTVLVAILFFSQEGWTKSKKSEDSNTASASADSKQPRNVIPNHGLYRDYRAQRDGDDLLVAGNLRIKKVATNEVPQGVTVKLDAGSSNMVVHILARELTEPFVRDSLTNGHSYLADDSICDPTGFIFGAVNNQGVFTMGDTVNLLGKTKVMAFTPIGAKLRLFKDEIVVKETTGTNITFETKEAGTFRVEARLLVDGKECLWIVSSAVYLQAADLLELAMLMPSNTLSPEVERAGDIIYSKGAELEEEKHKLDVYRLKERTNAPVFIFAHGGSWKAGDRSQYQAFGNRFAKEGIVTVVPSYRLANKNPHPAQIEDVAAAFDWTVRHIAEYGGDTNRIYIGGHSAGGHLAALLALDGKYLAKYNLTPKSIRGVLALSGVYDLREGENFDGVFGKDIQSRKDASPLFFIKPNTPPFLITYCEWDYFSLPAQAKAFHQALRKAEDAAELVYIPGESHLSEMFRITGEKDLTAAAVLKFIKN